MLAWAAVNLQACGLVATQADVQTQRHGPLRAESENASAGSAAPQQESSGTATGETVSTASSIVTADAQTLPNTTTTLSTEPKAPAPPKTHSLLIAYGYGGALATTLDGKTWKGIDIKTGPYADNNYNLRGMCVGGADGHTLLVVGGGTTMPGDDWYSRMVWSDDAVAWTEMLGHDNWWGGCAYGNGHFVAVGGNGETKTSSDGKTWDAAVTATSAFGNYALRGVWFGNGLFHAYGDGTLIMTSADGKTWKKADDAPPVDPNAVSSVTTGGGIYVGVQANQLVASNDGQTWQPVLQTTDLGTITGAMFVPGKDAGHGTFYYFGNVKVATSADGRTWTELSSNRYMAKVLRLGELFVMVNNQNFFYSVDGKDWQAAVQPAVQPINDLVMATMPDTATTP